MRRLLTSASTTLRIDPATSAVIVAIFVASSGLISLGAYAWSEGELKRTYSADYDTAWTAAADALQSMKINVLEQERDEMKGAILGRMADETDVQVRITPINAGTTRIGVRVGLLVTDGRVMPSDREAALRIHEAIQKGL